MDAPQLSGDLIIFDIEDINLLSFHHSGLIDQSWASGRHTQSKFARQRSAVLSDGYCYLIQL